MLNVLRNIIQEVSSARNLDQALGLIVQRVKQALSATVCSVYLVDEESADLVLMASDGLLSTAVGEVRMSFDQGLVGLVAQRAEPINLDNAPEHPRYQYFSETGEEKFHAFLGVPIIHNRQLLGVLVLQQAEACRYSEDRVTFMITIAAQLAGAIAHARVIGDIGSLGDKAHDGEQQLKGLPGAPGIGIGQAVVLDVETGIEEIPDRAIQETEQENDRFLQAVAAVKQDIQRMVGNMADVLPAEELALFDAYVMMLDSDSLIGAISSHILAGNWAPGAVREIIMAHVQLFSGMDDPYLRERAEDVRDLGRRILKQLQQSQQQEMCYPKNTILVGEDISASMLAEVPARKLVGVVSRRGSRTSHTAILASALGIPAVLGVEDLPVAAMADLDVIVDGYSGFVYLNASRAVSREYRRLQKQEQLLSADLKEIRDLEAITTDGYHISLYANTGLLSDIKPSLDSGAEGVGLYRTEFPFMVRKQFPGEQEQYDIYRQVLNDFAPRPVTMRTLDIGGDKALPYFPIQEDNPFLGWRGIRITLDHPEIFLVQIRSMLRANAGLNNLQILLPMISTLSELDEAIELIHRAHKELREEGYDISLPPIGAMVEVPSLVYQVDALVRRVDFISIGSNDLTQYLLAVDRNNSQVASLYDSLHPAVIQAISQVVAAARQQRIPVSVCGEMAGDPVAALVLLGMGVTSLSMSASSLPRIKKVIREFSRRRSKSLLKKAMEMEAPQAIRQHLNAVLEKAGLGGLIRAGN